MNYKRQLHKVREITDEQNEKFYNETENFKNKNRNPRVKGYND